MIDPQHWSQEMQFDPLAATVVRQPPGDGEGYWIGAPGAMYDAQDELIGIYHISVAEMPPPWELTKEIYGGAGPVIEYEHWGLFFYFQDPTRACETQGSGVFMTSAG